MTKDDTARESSSQLAATTFALSALTGAGNNPGYDSARRHLHGKRRTSLSATDPGRSRKARRRARS